MLRLISQLGPFAMTLLAGCAMAAQARPQGATARGENPNVSSRWEWPKTIEVYPPHPGDAVRLVGITKGRTEVVSGAYAIPPLPGTNDHSENVNAVKEWLKDASFVLNNQTPKTIVAVGISVVFPARDSSIECPSITGSKSAREPWCDANPHWCDGGCPELIHNTLHWGRIPSQTLAGLQARYYRPPYLDGGRELPFFEMPFEGKDMLRLAPGGEITVSLAGRGEAFWTITDPRKGITDLINGILFNEGIEEAQDLDPCEVRAQSSTGCAFAKVPMFNIGIDIVYFQDGTIWGNYGYGFATPNPDGIYRRQSFPDGDQDE